MYASSSRRRLVLFLLTAMMMVGTAAAYAQDAAPTPPAGEVKVVRNMFSTFFSSPDMFGSLMIWTLILMSVTVVALSIEAFMTNSKANMLPTDNIAEYERLVTEKKYSEVIERAAGDRSVFGQVLHASLTQASQGFVAMERAIEEYADAIGSKRIRGLEYLNILGAIGPMVGLFGTVYGMILAFNAMVSAGGQPKPAELAGGVSSALVCTFWGLVVGIPAIVVAAVVRNQIDGIMVDVMIQAEMVIARFKPSAKKPAAGATSSAGSPSTAPAMAAKPRPA